MSAPTVQEAADELQRRLMDPSRWRGKLAHRGHLGYVPRIECVDGWSISVQTSEFHYCAPRDSHGPWVRVECGYPSAAEPLLLDHAEDRDNPTSTVYGFTPIEVVAAAIVAHGGFKGTNTPEAA